MKKIICELCEGTEFTKENGMFVCQGCGTKYSAEEARSMMREVEGAAPASTGTPVVDVMMNNTNQAQMENILVLATTAYEAQNYAEAENYCNRAIEMDAACYKAWMLKGKAIGWQSTLQNSRIVEASHSFKHAVDFAPDEEKNGIAEDAIGELKRLGLACVSLRQKRFSQHPNEDDMNGFASDLNPFIEGWIVLHQNSTEMPMPKDADVTKFNALGALLGGNKGSILTQLVIVRQKAKAAGVPSEFFSQVTAMMENAAMKGFNMASAKYDNNSRPMRNDFKKTMDEVDNCILLLNMVDILAAYESDDESYDTAINRINNKIKMEEYCIGMAAYADYSSTYRNFSLTSAAKNGRRGNINDYQKSINEKKAKIEEKKRARIAAYWEAHPDEKAALDDKKRRFIEKKTALESEITELDNKISAIKLDEAKIKVPSEEESDNLRERLRDLENRRANLGLFAGKEKKQIGEEIASIYVRIGSLMNKISDEKKAKNADLQKKLAPIQSKIDELNSERTEVLKRIAAVDAELTKDPEE